VEVNCESDFVARTEEFQQFAHDLAMQICATDPRFLRKEDVTPDVLQREKEVLRSQAAATGKPENVLDRIVEGKLGKFYEDNCLYEQHFIKDGGSGQTVCRPRPDRCSALSAAGRLTGRGRCSRSGASRGLDRQPTRANVVRNPS